MKRWIALVCVAIGACALPAVAGASTRGTPAVNYGTSCVDTNNDGSCAGEPSLASKLVDGIFTVPAPQHASDPKVGIVLQGGVVLPNTVILAVTGNIHVSGSVSIPGDDGIVSLATSGGSIYVDGGSKLDVHRDLSLTTMTSDSTIDIGAGITASVKPSSGAGTTMSVRSAGTLHVGANQKYSVGGDYSDMELMGASGVTVDPNQSFTAPNHGGYYFDSGGDITFDSVTWKAGYFHIRAHPPTDTSHVTPTITIKNSTFTQTYKNGDFTIEADVNVLGTINISDTTITTKTWGHIVNPSAHCTNVVAPDWVCG